MIESIAAAGDPADVASSFRGAPKARTRNAEQNSARDIWTSGPADSRRPGNDNRHCRSTDKPSVGRKPPTGIPFQLRSAGRTNGSSAALSASLLRSRSSVAAIITSAARPAPSSHFTAMPMPCSGSAAQIDALGAGLQRRSARRTVCMTSVQNRPVPATCHGCAAQASRSRAAARARCGQHVRAAAEPREGQRQRVERQRPGRHRAAVDRADVVRTSGAWLKVLQRVLHRALHRMRRLDVVAGIGAGGAGDAEKARMLARAVVVERAWRCRRRAPAPAPRAGGSASARRIRSAEASRPGALPASAPRSATWPGSPQCDAQASASSSGPKP